MWAMAHRWRFAWHGNLGLQLAWLPYDTMTKQYGLLALGSVMVFVSLKACLVGAAAKRAGADATPARRGHRRDRRSRALWRVILGGQRRPAARHEAGHALPSLDAAPEPFRAEAADPVAASVAEQVPAGVGESRRPG
jgi:hypothetical protein